MGRPPRITRDQILETARRVFTLKGYASATLADIARQLEVTPAALLRHVASKQSLFNEAMRPAVALPQCVVDLQRVDASTDPRIVLRSLAEQWVPFAEQTIAQNIAVSQHERSRRTIVLPFEPGADDSPPRRGLRIVTDYFRRARRAGVIRVADPKAAALMFMGSLIGYVFIHRVAEGLPRPYPLADYIDALIELWTRGAIGGSRGSEEALSAETTRTGGRDPHPGHRLPRVRAAAAEAAGDRAGRNAGSADRQRRVARRRTRDRGPR